MVGKWLKTKPRESVILATKVAGAASGWFVPPIRHGYTACDRFHIERAIDGSLKRLGTDYIDLYQIHWPDMIVPIEETLRTMDTLVQSGKVRYIGTSNDTARGTMKSLMVSKYEKLSRFESIQNNFSLLNRRDLTEIGALCREEKISLLPYSPLGGGVLSGKYNQAISSQGRFSDYINSNNKRQRLMAARFLNDKTLASTQEYLRIASVYGLDPVTMAIAWSKQFDFVASTIIGATTPEQLDASLAAMNVTLNDEILKELDAVHAKILYPMG
jgi:aryl-alcohol dehydrogenase-like predicted oxidoreductase